MRFTIEKSDEVTFNFVNWLLFRIRKLLLRSINIKLLEPYAQYISSTLINITPQQLRYQLVRYVYSLHVVELRDAFLIQPRYFLEYQGVPLVVLVDIVEFGTLDIRGLYSFARVFDYVQREIKVLYSLYSKVCLLR